MANKVYDAWKRPSFGYFLVAVAAAVCVRWYFHTPPPSYSVTFMAVAAALMALRPEMRGREKWFWTMVLFAFAWIEIRAIKHDREVADQQRENFIKEERQHFSDIGNGIKGSIEQGQRDFAATMSRSDAIMVGLGDTIKTQTGGDSFAFVTFTAQPAAIAQLEVNNFLAPKGVPFFWVSVTSHGKYPLNGVHAIIIDDERRLAAMQEYNQHPNGEWIKAIDSADTEYEIPYLRPQSAEAPQGDGHVIGMYEMPQGDSKKLTIPFSAPNGHWTEVLHLGRVKGVWHQCLSVSGPTVKQVKHPFIYCDGDWPDGKKLAEKDWAFAPPKKR